MKSLTVVTLTSNESIHISRCIETVQNLKCRIVVVDSYSTDDTCEIAEKLGADVYQNKFITQAHQFQWAIDNCDIDSNWILRLDADETIDQKLSNNIKNFIIKNGYGHNGAVFHRKHIFLGKWVKFGGRYPLPMLRLFRNGYGHVEQRWMDEHIVLDKGTTTILSGGFSDNNLNSVSWFINKHNSYATREMVDIMLKRLDPENDSKITEGTGFSIRLKRFLKQNVYMKLPFFVRPFIYFVYRYIFQLGFLDGMRGFAYHFMQGFWYRTLVDLKCLEISMKWRKCDSEKDKLEVLEKISGYKLTQKTSSDSEMPK